MWRLGTFWISSSHLDTHSSLKCLRLVQKASAWCIESTINLRSALIFSQGNWAVDHQESHSVRCLQRPSWADVTLPKHWPINTHPTNGLQVSNSFLCFTENHLIFFPLYTSIHMQYLRLIFSREKGQAIVNQIMKGKKKIAKSSMFNNPWGQNPGQKPAVGP